jgi:hypothetical protein
VFENRVLRRIFGPKRDEVMGGWRKVHNEELHDIYALPSIIRMIKPRRMKWAGHVAQMRKKRNAYRLLAEKPEGKKPPGRPTCRWVDNMKMDFLEIGWGGMDWIGLSQNRDKWRAFVNAVMNLWVHKLLGISQVATQLVVSGVVFSSIQLVMAEKCNCPMFGKSLPYQILIQSAKGFMKYREKSVYCHV